MRHRTRRLASGVTLAAMAFTQACFGPVRTRPGEVRAASYVYISRPGNLTLHHQDTKSGTSEKCIASRVNGRVVRIVPDTIVLSEVWTSSAGRSGDCTFTGEAILLTAEAEGFVLERRGVWVVGTIALVILAVPVGLLLAVVWSNEVPLR